MKEIEDLEKTPYPEKIKRLISEKKNNLSHIRQGDIKYRHYPIYGWLVCLF